MKTIAVFSLTDNGMMKNLIKNIESDALTANLLETAEEVTIDAELQPLLDIVVQYKGLHNTLESLLYEICHPYRNWNILVPQLRSFVLKNSTYYMRHEKGPRAFTLFAGIFVVATKDSEKNSKLLSQIIEAQVAWVAKMVDRSAIPPGKHLCSFQLLSVAALIQDRLFQATVSHQFQDYLFPAFPDILAVISTLAGRAATPTKDGSSPAITCMARHLSHQSQFSSRWEFPPWTATQKE